MQWIFAIQLMVFAALLALLYPKAIRLSLVPSQVERQRAHRRAVEQFLTQNMTATAERTGVLIFVSVAERYAEVIPDTGIAQKVPAATWQDVVDALTADIGAGQPAEGFVRRFRRSEDISRSISRLISQARERTPKPPDRTSVTAHVAISGLSERPSCAC